MASYYILIFGILMIVGGIMGYVKARSLPSIFSGVAFGLILIVTSYLMMQGSIRAAQFALGLSVVLIFIFVQRFKASKKFMPAGLMLILSGLAVIILGKSLFL